MSTPLNWPVGLLLVAVLGAGLALWIAGRRGRRVNDHPHCRACGFDLIGLFLSARCPECGAELAHRRAVVSGLRRRRPWLLLFGMILILVPSAVLGASLYRLARAYDWNRVKPSALLIWELRRDEAAAGPLVATPNLRSALDELIRRANGDRLSEGNYAALLPLARARQADPIRGWDPRWGRLIERGFDVGKIAEPAFNRYLDGVIIGLFEVRPVVRAGRPLPARLAVEARAGPLSWVGFSGERLSLKVAGRDRPDIGGKLLRTGGAGGEVRRGWPGPKYLGERFIASMDVVDLTATGRMVAREDWSPVLAPEEPGEYTITTAWRFRIQRSEVPKLSPSGEASRRRVFDREFTRTFTVVPADQPTVKTIEPPGPDTPRADRSRVLERDLREAFRVQRHNPVMLNGLFSTGPAPCPYAFQVFAAYHDREVRLGTLVPIPDDPFDERDTRQFLLDLPAPLGGVEYILRPDAEAAELTVDLKEIWGGEIRIAETGPLPGMLR